MTGHADGISWADDGVWNATFYGFAAENDTGGRGLPSGVVGDFSADTFDTDDATGIAVRGVFGARKTDD